MEKHEIKIEQGTLMFPVGNAQISLSSCELVESHPRSLNIISKVNEAHWPLFTEEYSVTPVKSECGSNAVQIVTSVYGGRSNAKAHITLCTLADLSVAMKLYFTADTYEALGLIELKATSDKPCAVCFGNKWQEIKHEEASFCNWIHVGDLRAYDEQHAFEFLFAPEAKELSEPERVVAAYDFENIQSGDMTIQLVRTQSGLALGAILDAKGGIEYHAKAPEALFNIMLRTIDNDIEEYVDSRKGWNVVLSETRHGTQITFERSDVVVILNAVKEEAKSRIAWETDIRLYDDNLTVVWAEPLNLYADLTDDSYILTTYASGNNMPMRHKKELSHYNMYPSGGVCMQYFAVHRTDTKRGLYFGHHDPIAAQKIQIWQSHNGQIKLNMLIYAQGVGEPANGMHIDGSIVWQLFDGDWYDATIIYRDWVFAKASWFRKVKSKDRKDVPQWLMATPVWILGSVENPESKWMEEIIEMREDIGYDVPVALHIYNWHQIPFDTNYPHYNPAKEEFIKKCPVLQAHDIKVMPYINGRLWDTHDRGDEDYQFTKLAKPWATKDHTGGLHLENYEARMSNGEYVMDAIMCPSTGFWQDKVQELTNWILNDLNTDAVYIDQIASMEFIPCMDKTHLHRPGGGSWWYEHYINMMQHCNEVCPPEKCYTTESNAEQFVGWIGGMLTWVWSSPDQVPAFPVVYSGYQPIMGRCYGVFAEDDHAGFLILTAQAMCFGDQLGWINPKRYLNSPYKAFMRGLVHLRWQYSEYFHSGRCLRPPMLEGDLGLLKTTSKVEWWGSDPKPEIVQSPGVISGMWERFSDGKRIVVLVNMNEDRRIVTAHPEGSEPFTVTLEPLSGKICEI